MKHIKIAIAALALIPAAITAEAQSFQTTPHGLQYMIVKGKESNGRKPVAGDFVKLFVVNAVNDSVLYDSRKMMGPDPVEVQLSNPQYNGDVAEGIAMMSPGDSGIFRIPVDSIMKVSKGQPLPPYLKPGGSLEFRIVLAGVESKEEKMKADNEKAAKQKETDDKLLQEYFTKNGLKPKKTANGLYYVIHKEGTGAKAKAGEKVTVNYTGKTLDGKTFDSNVDSNFHHVQPFSFMLGRGQVIKGWDEGVELLNKGAKATLYIPSTMAYGSRGAGPGIGANAILMFDVEVTGIEAEGAMGAAPTAKPAATPKTAPKSTIKKK